MLRLEPRTCYYVYPSWAEPPYSWSDLSRYLSDPLNSPLIREDPNWRRYDWQELGYPLNVQPFELIDGPAGGGIIRAHIAYEERWLPAVVLHTGVNIRSPLGMSVLWDLFNQAVLYLEPMDEPGWEFGLGKKKKSYVCGTSPEHADAAGDNVYWVVGFRRSKGEIRKLDLVPTWAESFGIQAFRLQSIPEALRIETSSWFVDPSYTYTWFTVQGGGSAVGYHYAVVVYLAYHLHFVTGKRMTYMHLVSNIEGKPNARLKWSRK